MEILKIIILSFSSAVVLFILTKLMGNKEISQLSMFDYIIGITIGSIAAEMSTSLEENFMHPLVAMVMYAIIAIIISVLSYKSLKMRRFFSGNALILLDNGVIFKENLKKAKLDLNEFLMQSRINGYFNISDIQTAVLETNGRISFLPASDKKPVTPKDLNVKVEVNKPSVSIIIDGVVLKENLYFTGNDELWLQKQLVSKNTENIKDIFYACCDSKNNLLIYKKGSGKNSHDIFQ